VFEHSLLKRNAGLQVGMEEAGPATGAKKISVKIFFRALKIFFF